MSAAESKLFTTITVDTILAALTPLRKAGVQFYIITAESGYCPACHSDLSSANITAPNSLLGHLRRSKKCIAKREERGVKLFGLKQPDSLLWGSVDDLTALDQRRFPDRNLWVTSVFPPTRPTMTTPMYASISQWHARTGSADSSPPPSSSGSDDGWPSSASASSSSSSGGNSPSSTHFSQQYVQSPPSHYALYDPSGRRESNSTITQGDYYAKQPMYAQPPQNFGAVPMTTGTMPSQQLPQQQYRGVPQPMGAYPQQFPQQPMYVQGQQPPMYTPNYQYPAPNYSW